MLLPKFLSRKISPEKSLDFLSQKIRHATGVKDTLTNSWNNNHFFIFGIYY